MSEQLNFKVEGEFITDLARQWFWLEDRPYSQCEELLLSCMMGSTDSQTQLKQYARDILEGRSKFTGINHFLIVDDGKEIRYIQDKFDQTRRKMKIAEMQNRMNGQMIDFVDPYSTQKSLKSAKNTFSFSSLHSCQCFFWHTGNYTIRRDLELDMSDGSGPEIGAFPCAYTDTCGGLWLYDHPEIVVDILDSGVRLGKEEFWAAVYEKVKDFDSSAFKERNTRYLAELAIKKSEQHEFNATFSSELPSQEDAYRIWGENIEEVYNCINDTEKFCENQLKKYDTPTLKVCREHAVDALTSEIDLMFIITPDNILKWEGLIDPSGHFYSCDFGGHGIKAQHIILTHIDDFPDLQEERLDVDWYLDELLSRGWCATRFLPTKGNYIYTPQDANSDKQVTSVQSKTIMDAVVKFEITDCDLSKLI